MIRRMLELLLPNFCIGCEKIGTQLCNNCLNHICFIDQEHPQAKRATTHLPAIWSAVEYRDIAQDIVKTVKYDRFWSYSEVMAQLVFRCLETEIRAAEISVFVPAPLASSRKKWRGFNQAETLAKNLGKQFSLPVETHALRRRTARINQAKLNKAERQLLEHDYVARPHTLKNSTVCLVDDVTTTGATLEACAAALYKVGIQKIYGLTFAAA